MSEAIHFPLIPGRKLAASGDSDFRGFCVLFTLDETARLEQVDEEFLYRFQTDRAGMETALHLGRCASDALSRAIDVLGKLIVHADLTELDGGDHAAIGWMVCGLGELSQQANEAVYGIAKGLANGHYLSSTGDTPMPKPSNNCPRCGDSSWNGYYCKNCGYDHKHEELPPNDRKNPLPIKTR